MYKKLDYLNLNEFLYNKIVLTVKRKEAVANCLVYKSKNKINNLNINLYINGIIFYKYFKNIIDINKLVYPLKICSQVNKYQIYFFIKVKGGGYSAQSQASSSAMAKCLSIFFTEYRNIFKKYLLLRIDSRIKERRKYGLKKARKAPQYTKR